jgi:hypothetical protein
MYSCHETEKLLINIIMLCKLSITVISSTPTCISYIISIIKGVIWGQEEEAYFRVLWTMFHLLQMGREFPSINVGSSRNHFLTKNTFRGNEDYIMYINLVLELYSEYLCNILMAMDHLTFYS